VVATLSLAAQQAPRRWSVDNNKSPGSFATIAEAVEAAGAGDTIVVRASARPYAGGFSLKSGQTLRGEGSVIIAADSDVVCIADTSGDVTLSNVTIQAWGKGSGVVVRKAERVVIRDVVVSAVDAPAVSIEESDLDVAFSGVSVRGQAASGIVLRKTTGHFTVSGGTIDGPTERAISVVNASNVSLHGVKVIRGARVNGVPAKDCGNDLITGSNERCNAAVYLAGVEGAVLDGIVIDGSAQAGIVAHDVSGLALLNSEIRNAGDELFEHGLLFQDLRGECRIVDTKVERSASRHLMLHNSAGALALLIERSTFADNPAPNGQQGVLISAGKTANINLTVRGSTFARSFSHALDVTARDEAKVTLRVTGTTFNGNATAISVSATGRAAVEYVIADNPSIAGSSAGAAINVYRGTPSIGTMSGTISRNTIEKSRGGIVLTSTGNGLFTAEVGANVIQEVGGVGIAAIAGQGDAQMRVTITGNILRKPVGSNAPAIRVQSGTTRTDRAETCADIGGSGPKANTIEGAWQSVGAIDLLHRFGGTHFRLAGLAGDRSDAAAAAAVSARNRNAKVRAVLRPESQVQGFEPADECRIRTVTP